MKTRNRRGGSRKGAGRPKNSGMYGEDTEPIRVPVRSAPYLMKLVNNIWSFLKNQTSEEDLLPLIFDDLTQALSKSLDSKIYPEEAESKANDETSLEQSPQSNLVELPLIKPLQRKPLTRDQRSRLYPSAIAASFGVTSTSEQDNPGKRVDLHHMLVKDPITTFFLTVAGDSMNKAGIHSGDLVVVQQITDSWTQLTDGTIVTALVEGVQTVKRFEEVKGKTFLVPESDNPEHQPLEIEEGMDVSIFGIVMYSIHPTNNRRVF
jgi:DNA polymerase V